MFLAAAIVYWPSADPRGRTLKAPLLQVRFCFFLFFNVCACAYMNGWMCVSGHL